MRSKISLKLTLLIVGIVVIVFFAVITFFSVSNSSSHIALEPIPISPVISQALQNLIDSQSTGSNSTTSKQSNVGLPVRLKIPKINVDAAVEYLGLTFGGAMDVPKGPNDVAWFNLGPRPGEIGSAVIDGHYGWKDNIPAVFDNLFKLKKGDKIYIVDERGTTVTFVVKEIGIYPQNGDATNVFSSNDGKAHLNLITCEGVWNIALQNRPSRLVIFTDEE
jgi:LPXTG-site transpeptidase (sortase) family protein